MAMGSLAFAQVLTEQTQTHWLCLAGSCMVTFSLGQGYTGPVEDAQEGLWCLKEAFMTKYNSSKYVAPY